MVPLLKLACLIDTQSILKYVNIGLTVLLILVLGVLVLVFLRGLLRGWRYGTYRLIFFAIMVTTVLATLGAQANALGGMNLERFNLPALNLTLTIDGVEHAICVKWTTLQDSLEDLIIQIAEAFGAKASYSGILSYASVLATSLIKLLLIFVWGILLSTLGLLLIMLLWHLIFKRFTPLDRRKIKKLRVVSAFEELLVGAVCVGMLLSPFTSIVNSMNSNFKVEDEKAKQNETVSMITDILGVYDQSAFAKTFFSWNSMDGSTTFDQQLVSFLTQSEVKEVKTDLISEISAIADISAQAINVGLLSLQGSEGINWFELLSASSIPDLIYALSETKLIQCALPFAVSLAVNLDAVKDVLGEETCKYLSESDTDWAEAVQSMSRIYDDLLDAGVIHCVKDVESSTPQFDWTNLQYVFSGKDVDGRDCDAKGAMHDLTSEFKDSALFSHLMAGLLSQLGKAELEKEESDRGDLSILDFLPLTEDKKDIDYDALVELDYTKEFNLLYDTIYSINEVSPEVVTDVLNLVQEPPTEETSQEAYKNLLCKSAKYASDYVELVVGERDENGEPKENSKDCLFDSAFVGNALPSLLTFIEKSGSSAMEMDLTLTKTKGEAEEWELKDYKREFGATLDVAAEFASSEAGLAFLEDGTGMAYKNKKLISIDPELVKALQNSLELSDKSKIMTEVMPQVADKYFDDFRSTLSQFGIENVDFECENFGTELSYLLNLISYSGDLILALNNIEGASTHLMATMLLEEKDSLVRILDIFAGSKILNPVDASTGKKNMNIASLLNYVFSSAGLEDFKLEADALDGLTLVSERKGNDIGGDVEIPHENALIVEALTSASLSDLMSLGNASSGETMKALSRIDVEKLFANIGQSEVMRSVAGSAMDKYFTSVLDVDEKDGITFKNLTSAEDWKAEGKTIQKIVNLATKGIDISEFKIDTVSPGLAKDLFTNLANSKIFLKKTTDADGTTTTEYKFPQFFSSKILGMLDKDSLPYFLDKGVSLPSGFDFNDLEAKKGVCKKFVENCLDLEQAEDWTKQGGEVEAFSSVLAGVQSLGGFNEISSFSRDNLPKVRSLLESLASSSSLGQVLLANALGKALSSLGSSSSSTSLDLSLANSDVFFEDKFKQTEERVAEVSALCDVMDVLFDQNYGLLDADGKFDDSRLNVSSLSVDNCLKPLLDGIASSDVLNKSKGEGSDTFLRSILKTILVKSSLYKVEGDDAESKEFAPSYAPKMSISKIVDSLRDEELSDEINKLCNVIKLVQDSSLLNGDSFDSSSLKSISKEELSSLLSSINDSKLLYRSLALQIEDAVKSASLPSPFQEDLERFCPYLRDETNATQLDYVPYSEEEIECVATLVSSTSQFSSLDFAKISEISKADFSELFSSLFASQIFNEQYEASDGLTSAQAFLKDVLVKMGLDDLIYPTSSSNPSSPISPKDQHLSQEYSSVEGKCAYLVKHYIGISEDGNYKNYSLAEQQKESNAFYQYLGAGEESLTTFLSNLSKHNLSSLLEGDSIDFASLTGSSSTLSYLLKDLSHCAFLRDAPINALADYLSGTTLSVDGIDLSLTNYYYPYSYDGSGAKITVNYDRGYDDDEIDLLVDLLDLVDANKASLNDGDVGKLDAYSLRQMLLEFKDSLLFHQTGANSGKSSDLTVFEQMMYRVYETSGLAENSFDSYHDFAYLQQASSVKKDAIKLKLNEKIKGMSDGDWASEITLLTTNDLGTEGLIQSAKSLESKGALNGGSITMSNDLIEKLAPGEVMKLLTPLAKSKVAGDAFGATIRSFFSAEEGGGGLGVEEFTERLVSKEGQYEFISNSAFKDQGIAYDKVTFASASYTGSETITFQADPKGDLSYTLDLKDTAKFDAGIWQFDTSSLRCDFKITISAPGTLAYSFNAVNYFAEGGVESTLNAIELFLCSLYIDEGTGNKTYYTFKDDASSGDSTLQEACDKIDLYGLCAILMKSGFYANSYFNKDFVPTSSSDADASFSASALALYQLFSVKVEVSTGVSAKVQVLDAIDAPALGANASEEARYASIQKLIQGADPFAEGEFLQRSLKGIAASEAVHLVSEAAFSSLSGVEKEAAYLSASNQIVSYQSITGGDSLLYGDYYEAFLDSRKVSYDYTIDDGLTSRKQKGDGSSVFADSLIANALNKRVSERLRYADLDSHTLAVSPSDPTRKRIDFLSKKDQNAMRGFDAYGYDDASKSYAFSDLDKLIETEKMATRFAGYCAKGYSFNGTLDLEQYKLTAAQKKSLDELCTTLDKESNVSSIAYMHLAYASDAYDYLVLKGNVALAGLNDYFFHVAAGAFGKTDFPNTDGEGYLKGSPTSFSYQSVASTFCLEA